MYKETNYSSTREESHEKVHRAHLRAPALAAAPKAAMADNGCSGDQPCNVNQPLPRPTHGILVVSREQDNTRMVYDRLNDTYYQDRFNPTTVGMEDIHVRFITSGDYVVRAFNCDMLVGSTQTLLNMNGTPITIHRGELAEFTCLRTLNSGPLQPIVINHQPVTPPAWTETCPDGTVVNAKWLLDNVGGTSPTNWRDGSFNGFVTVYFESPGNPQVLKGPKVGTLTNGVYLGAPVWTYPMLTPPLEWGIFSC